jgi:hypothetical protein
MSPTSRIESITTDYRTMAARKAAIVQERLRQIMARPTQSPNTNILIAVQNITVHAGNIGVEEAKSLVARFVPQDLRAIAKALEDIATGKDPVWPT